MTINISDYLEPNGRKNGKWSTGENLEGKAKVQLQYYPSIRWEGLWKTTKRQSW